MTTLSKNLTTLLLSLFCVMSATPALLPPGEPLPIALVPKPSNIERSSGSFTIDRSTAIAVEEGADSLKPCAEFLAEQLRHATALPIPVAPTGPRNNVIVFSLLPDDQATKPESYRLTVTPRGVRIEAPTAAGAFYAMQTLMQLFPTEIEVGSPVYGISWEIPAVRIEDAPRFPWRGMHLDACRHFAPVWFVKKYIDLNARYKFNTFHWHLTDDQGWRVEVKKYPKLMTIGSWRKETLGDGIPHGGFYTQEEIRDVVAYARQRFVTVVPELEMPGHSTAAIASYPELSCTGGPFPVRTSWGVAEDVYCPGNEQTFEFLEGVLTEVIGLFPGTFFHIGGDECPKTRWKACPKCQARMKAEGLATEHELQSYFVKRIEKFLNAHGRRLIGWDEILEGGLAPNASVMSWRGIQGGIDAAKAGHDVVMTPTSHCYFDYYQGLTGEPRPIGDLLTLEKVYSYEPVPPELSPAEARHILGAQGNLWSEFMDDPRMVEYMAFPRACALSEVVWSAPQKDFADFSARMASHYERLLRRGVNVRVPSPAGCEGTLIFRRDTTCTIVNAVPGAVVRYTIDGTEPTRASRRFERPLTVDRSLTLKTRTFLPNGGMSPVATAFLNKIDPAVNGLDTTSLAGDQSAALLSGVLMVEREGLYTFWLTAEKNAWLTIDGAPVAADTMALWYLQGSGRMVLPAGPHEFRLTYARPTRRTGPALEVEGPGMERQPLPPAMLRRK